MLPVSAAVDAVTLPMVEEVLDNGLRVLVQPDATSPLVAVAVGYAVGAASDPEDASGLAHLVEHLMYEGSAQAPDGAYDAWLADAGGANNAWTEPDATVYYAWGPPGLLDLVLYLEADRMAGLELTPVDLANQLDVVARERLGEGDWTAGFEALQSALWPEGHPYHRPLLGSAEQLADLHLADVEAWLDRYHGPEGAVVVVVGDVSAEAAVASVRRWFEGLEGGERAAPAAEVSPGSGRFYAAHGGADASVWMAWPLGSEHAASADVLARVLDERLQRLVRGQVVDVEALTWHGRLQGELVLHLTVDDTGTARGARRLERAVRRVARRPPREAEIQQAAVRLWSDQLDDLERVEDRAGALAWCVAVYDDPGCVAGPVEGWWTVGRAEVRALARELRRRPPVVVHVDEPLGQPLDAP